MKSLVNALISRVYYLVLILLCIALFAPGATAQRNRTTAKGAAVDTLKSSTFNGLKWRSIGPAWASGRIADFAVNPKNISEYYVAVASGHIWKTTNGGVTFSPVFDDHQSYSIGALAMDPTNSDVVWAGTGENNHQRALGYGDGVYKTTDGGKGWKNMGLKESRQIGMIAIDPRNTDVVYVAAEGSVWGPGGERGLYKTVNGGETWDKVLNISENTGINNVVLDPRNPDVVYATSEQRRRHVWTKIGGGPESGLHKSLDGGKTWKKLTSGLPSGHVGGMGIALAPSNPDIVYIIVEAEGTTGGFFRSLNGGATFARMNDYHASGQYYNEIVVDPRNENRVYSMDTYSMVTQDGGKTWNPVGNSGRHVDDHAIWINPNNTDHFLIGGDGGIYETWNAGQHWHFKANLPVTQFYRVAVDNSLPFYNVYGGTQDNNSMGGPVQNAASIGVLNHEWFTTNGGDGFWTAIDPTNPNIVYAEAQYGNMVRYDKQSTEAVRIRPEPRQGEETYKWNWNTPLIISPHSPTRLYTAANIVFRSDDRGDTWQVISDDLSTGKDRNDFPVMGKFWSIDAVAKDISTSLFGTIVSFAESPVKENLLFAGTDDGLIQISEDAKTWRKVSAFPGVPEYTYVSDIFASRFDENVVFASFDNILRDDFKPYLLKSTDKGRTWTSIAANLPKNGTVHTIEQDFVNPDLLFVGTEFGFFFSPDGGKQWTQLKAGLPSIAVKDMAIQQRENDIVLATFGRGFYVLDDYSLLRHVNTSSVKKDAELYPVKDALMYVQSGAQYGQGNSYFAAQNPDFGANFTYFLKEAPKTMKQARREKEKELFKKGEPIPQPSTAQLREEENEIPPYLIFTIKDELGNVVRKLYERPKSGVNRVNWDLRYSGQRTPGRNAGDKFDPFARGASGMFALPGNYTVDMAMYSGGDLKQLAGPVSFEARPLQNVTLPAPDRRALVEFQNKVADVTRRLQGINTYVGELQRRLNLMSTAIHQTPAAPAQLLNKVLDLKNRVDQIEFTLNGPEAKASSEEIPPMQVPIMDRLGNISYAFYRNTSAPTSTQKNSYDIILNEVPPLYAKLKQISEVELPAVEREMDAAGVPTTGRLPLWY